MNANVNFRRARRGALRPAGLTGVSCLLVGVTPATASAAPGQGGELAAQRRHGRH